MDSIPPRDQAAAQAGDQRTSFPSGACSLFVFRAGHPLSPARPLVPANVGFLFIFLKRVELGLAFCRVPPAHKLIPRQCSQTRSLR